jgi:hypothetical protein
MLIVHLWAEVTREGIKSWDILTNELENCVSSCFLSLPEDDDEITDGVSLDKVDSDTLILQIKEGSYLDIISKRWMPRSIQIKPCVHIRDNFK